MVAAIKGGSLNAHAMIGRLDDGVLLRMKTAAEFMAFSGGDAPLLSKATNIETVVQSGRGAVVPCGKNLFIFNQGGSDLTSEAGRPLGDQVGDTHEILFPGRTTGMRRSLL